MNWRVTIMILIALLGGFAVLFAIVTRPIAAPHHEIYVNGPVLTMDSESRIAEAVSVRAGAPAHGFSDATLRIHGQNSAVDVDLVMRRRNGARHDREKHSETAK